MKALTFAEYQRAERAEEARPRLTKTRLLAVGARIARTPQGRRIKRILTKDGLRRPDLRRSAS